MNNLSKWFEMDVPRSWPEAIIRALKVAVAGFVVLQLKELIDAGMFDTQGTAIDSLLIAGAYLGFNAILLVTAKPNPASRNVDLEEPQ